MQYDKNRFKIQALPHPRVLSWVLFPVIMISELIFGQRLPKVTLVEKKSDKPLPEGSYIPCPHCETLNDARLWTKGNDLGHWFGLVCPSCHEIIPCLWNIFSLAVLAITFPLWYLPARFFRRRWIEKEKKRLARVLERPLNQAKSMHWLSIFSIASVSGVCVWVVWVICEVLWHGREWGLETMLDSLEFCIGTSFGIGLIIIWTEKDEEKEKERLANVPESPLIQAIQAKSIRRFASIKWFVRGTFYLGGFAWVASAVLGVLEGREWDLAFDILPVCLLLGWMGGAFMYVFTNLLDGPKSKKGGRT